MTSSAPKVMLLGLDGATFDLLDPLVAQGVMPNLGRLLRGGTRAPLRSTIPPMTAPAWTTMTSGVNPGRHGVFDFRRRAGGGLQWVNSHAVRAPRLWDLVTAAGGSTGIINVPLTFPPAPITGYMVSGFLTPLGDQSYISPADLGPELEAAIGEYVIYEPIPPRGLTEEGEILAYLRRIRRMVDQRAKALYWLMENRPTDMVMIVFQALDTLQHSFWKLLDRGEAAFDSPLAQAVRPALLDCYRQIDGIVGDIRVRLGESAYIVVASDHGFGPLSSFFHVNEWLAQQGLLEYSRWRLIVEKVLRRLRNWLPRRERDRPLIEQTTRFVPDHKAAINWRRTQAFSGEAHQQAIYVNLRGREPNGVVEPGAAYERVRDRIAALLDELEAPGTGRRIRCRALRREEIYRGPFLEEAPDLSIILDDYDYQLSTHFSLRGHRFAADDSLRGTHRRDGVLILHGPGVRPGRELEPVAIADVTPTVLHLMGLPIPEGLDGCLQEAALEAAWVDAHPPRYRPAVDAVAAGARGYSEEEAAEIETRLRGLGYLE